MQMADNDNRVFIEEFEPHVNLVPDGGNLRFLSNDMKA